MIRPLGSLEHSAWLHDRAIPVHFAMTARIAGRLSSDRVAIALTQMQERHPLLRAQIAPNDGGQPWLLKNNTPIPLRVVPRQGEDCWQQEVERELAQPFDEQTLPLLRVVLLHSKEVSELIVTCHHAIADGYSAAYLLRDILQAMSAPDDLPPRLPERPALEDLIPGIAKQSHHSSLPPNGSGVSAAAQPIRRSPSVLLSSLTAPETLLLVERSRQEQTSVHAAICAAFAIAIATHCRAAFSSREASTLKCLSPVSLRPYLQPSVGEEFGLYIGFSLTAHTVDPAASLWEVARSLKSQLNQAMQPENLLGGIPHRQAVMSTLPSPELAFQGFVQQYSYDLMVTNLGRLNFPQQFGVLQLEAIYGPAVLTGVANDRAIGVTTLGDRMFVTFVSLASEHSCAEATKIQTTAMQHLKLSHSKDFGF
jgi:Condensation domain